MSRLDCVCDKVVGPVSCCVLRGSWSGVTCLKSAFSRCRLGNGFEGGAALGERKANRAWLTRVSLEQMVLTSLREGRFGVVLVGLY